MIGDERLVGNKKKHIELLEHSYLCYAIHLDGLNKDVSICESRHLRESYSCPPPRVFIFRDVNAIVSPNDAHRSPIRLVENSRTIDRCSAHRPWSRLAFIFTLCLFYCTVKWCALDDDTPVGTGCSIVTKGRVCENSQSEWLGILSIQWCCMASFRFN